MTINDVKIGNIIQFEHLNLCIVEKYSYMLNESYTIKKSFVIEHLDKYNWFLLTEIFNDE